MSLNTVFLFGSTTIRSSSLTRTHNKIQLVNALVKAESIGAFDGDVGVELVESRYPEGIETISTFNF